MSLIEIENLSLKSSDRNILDNINCRIPKGAFVAILGENGAGKTTLMDLIMGFKKASEGSIHVLGKVPFDDPWQTRNEIAYLSEKVDVPGDWSVREFFDFNAFFYNNYSTSKEKELIKLLNVTPSNRIGNMSAGEIRRAQIVAALATQPSILLVDEITAVLDIVGRQKFMQVLKTANQERQCSIVMATNILEDLVSYASHVLLIKRGKCDPLKTLSEFLGKASLNEFSQIVAAKLEAA